MQKQATGPMKQINPVIGVVTIVVVLTVAIFAGYQLFLKPVPNEPINMSPGMKKMNEEMKAWAATQPWKKQENAPQKAPSEVNALGR